MSLDTLDSIQIAINNGEWATASSLAQDFRASHPNDYATDVLPF